MACIKLENVSVSFPIYDSTTRSLKNRLISSSTGGRIDATGSHQATVTALDGISLEIRDGDRIGLLGHNGAGKSTLLRLLAGVYEPCSGSIRVDGHVAPLFNISLGIDPEATGYENIIIRGLYLGIKRSQIEAKLPDIAEFTELGDFLDLPVRTYSAGMGLRLAFAVSTAIDPEILLLDEGIGAGDSSFIDKANARLDSFTQRASIIVLASHSPPLLRRMCDKLVLLEHGKIASIGSVDDILALYRQKFTSGAR